MQNETEEERQGRLDAVNEYTRAYNKRKKLVETEEQKRARSEYRSELARKLMCRETEEDRLKRMEYKRLHARKTWNKMTEDEHELVKAKMRERARRRLQNETPEQRKVRLQEYKERYHRRKEQETSEEAEACRKQAAEYRRQRRQNEIVRKKERERSRIYQQKKRQQMTPEELKANLTPEEKTRISLRRKKLYRRKKMTMTEVERQEELRRARDYRLKYATKRKMEETELERERRLERVRQKAHRRRLEETEEGCEEKKEKDGQYYRRKIMEQKTKDSGNSSTAPDESSRVQQISSASSDMGTADKPVRCSKISAQRKIRDLLEIEVDGASTDHELLGSNETPIVDKLSMKAVVLVEKIRVSDWSKGLTVPEAEDLENSFLLETNQSEFGVKSELTSHVRVPCDFVMRQVCPEMAGSKTVAVGSLQVDKPSNAQTVKISSNSLIDKWGLRELVVRLERIDVPKMVRYK